MNIIIDSTDSGSICLGTGMVSANNSSRLLLDYKSVTTWQNFFCQK